MKEPLHQFEGTHLEKQLADSNQHCDHHQQQNQPQLNNISTIIDSRECVQKQVTYGVSQSSTARRRKENSKKDCCQYCTVMSL
jgi:hypothetical protein